MAVVKCGVGILRRQSSIISSIFYRTFQLLRQVLAEIDEFGNGPWWVKLIGWGGLCSLWSNYGLIESAIEISTLGPAHRERAAALDVQYCSSLGATRWKSPRASIRSQAFYLSRKCLVNLKMSHWGFWVYNTTHASSVIKIKSY